MSQDNMIVLATLVAYKLILVGVGVWASRRNRTESDFFIAGQGLGPWVAGLSYAASTSSAWVLLGFSGFVYLTGLSALWMVPGIWGGYVAVWLWFGRRLRSETAAEGHVTTADFLAGGQSPGGKRLIAGVAAAMILFCFIFYIAAQFGAAAQAFETQFHLPRMESVLVGAGVVLIYSLLGGFWAVSVTDMLQGALMLLVACLLPVAALVAAGGPSGVMATLQANEAAAYLSFGGDMPVMLLAGFVVGVWGVGLGALGQPQLITRLMAVKDESARRHGFQIAIVWAVLVFIGMTVLGLSGRALVGAGSNGEALFYQVARDYLPPLIGGLVIAAVLSAVMSTVDSILLVAASAVSRDLGVSRRFKGEGVTVSRIVMVAIALVAVWMTLALPSTIFARVLFAWAALGAAFGPVIVMRVIGVQSGHRAVLAAMIVGFGLTVFFNAMGALDASTLSGPGAVAAQWAQLPGDPFERVFPWLPALLILWFGRVRATA
ncbi:sodium/proline symporter [Maricaulis maris]|uniref:Sodium/proline symporter n=1 Tax=Maricaulis maris TaxID=74318 RepID=A0A495DJ93_9PROT|nr:sodium/proline symporter [Maricaulis maris]RKR02700.1 sodium/proline symporter [Maricaulis maris]